MTSVLAASTLPSNPAAAQEIIARQRKRKRRPERATDGTTYLPLRDSSGALRALQEVCLSPAMRLSRLAWIGHAYKLRLQRCWSPHRPANCCLTLACSEAFAGSRSCSGMG